MDRTALSDIGKTSGREEDSQAINESTCSAKEASQLLLEEKQAIARREEDLKSETERGVIALNALAPIKQLSDDILCHIFELHCKDSLPATLPRNYFRRLAAPIILSHVCSAWREIMLDVPTFWRSIRIDPTNLTVRQNIDWVMKTANTWLSRAKGLPCSVDIGFSEDVEYCAALRSLWKADWHENIIRDLISRHKFKKLGVTFADHHLRDFLQLPDDNLSCVEDLCLRYIYYDTTSPWDLHKLPNLTSFSLLPNPFDSHSFCNPLKDYFKFASIPWHNLRHIRLHAIIPAPFCLEVLEHCSAVLETCSLVITGDPTFITSSPRVPVYLFQLRKLKVVVCSLFSMGAILESFLHSLRFPNLNSLILGSSDYPPYLENLLQMVKARSRVGDRDGKHWIEVTELKHVTLYCNEAEDQIEDEVLDSIEEIELSGVDLHVVYYSYSDSTDYSVLR